MISANQWESGDVVLLDLFTRNKHQQQALHGRDRMSSGHAVCGRGGVTVPLVLKCVDVVQVCSNSDVLLLVSSNAEDLSFDHHWRICVGRDQCSEPHPSWLALNTSRDGASTASLGDLFE